MSDEENKKENPEVIQGGSPESDDSEVLEFEFNEDISDILDNPENYIIKVKNLHDLQKFEIIEELYNKLTLQQLEKIQTTL